jgi:hypothetical protein
LLFDASYQGMFEDGCWGDDEAGTRWNYVIDLMGPYRLGHEVASTFRPDVVRTLDSRLDAHADRLASRMSAGATYRLEQLDAFVAGLRSDQTQGATDRISLARRVHPT